MKFDVMLPFYGDVSLMQAAVRSVLAQSHQDWRLTVVDDMGAEGLDDWFGGLGDSRVRYERNDRNLGVTRNYTKCIGLAEADYMTMMGTDDIMLPNYLASLDDVLTEFPGVGIIQPGVEVIDANGDVINTLADQVKKRIYRPAPPKRIEMGGEELAASLLRGCWFYFPSLCWRTDALRKTPLREDLRVIQDLALVVDLLKAGEQMAIDPVVCFQYRRHATSVSAASASSGSRFTEARAYFLDTAADLEAFGWKRAARASRRYLSSRMHAISLLPAAIRAGSAAGILTLSRHAFGAGR